MNNHSSSSSAKNNLETHKCLEGCTCAASMKVVPSEEPHLGVAISEDLQSQRLENPMLHLSRGKGLPKLSEKEKIARIEG